MKLFEYFSGNSKADRMDPLTGKTTEVRDLQNRLVAIDKEKLGCCTAILGKGGKPELALVDESKFKALVAESEAAETKINSILDYFGRVDATISGNPLCQKWSIKSPKTASNAVVTVGNEIAMLKFRRRGLVETLSEHMDLEEINGHKEVLAIDLRISELETDLVGVKDLVAKLAEA